MVFFKCKMCGGDLTVAEGVSIAECEYCGTKQTLPTSNDDVIVNLFNRANNLRLKGEYDKAADTYEKILDIDNAQVEAHWGLVLCKYGVEYVEDPLTKERIPTCHRTQMESILSDVDYRAVIENADISARAIYDKQAQEINELQRKILEIVKSEKPFDVFICYKESDESGARTKDSVIANEIYHELTNSGLKVFFAAITLEDKLGQEYEPYIFAALTSSKVMLVLGTKEEYFNAVWVKNEWARYLHLMKIDRKTKRTLIPCFRDMDAYDLPEEFSHLQALDMSSIAFMPDLTRNIQKLIGVPKTTTTPVVQQAAASVIHQYEPKVQIDPLLRRAFMQIEDGDFDKANDLLETVLNNDPENAKAYLGKFMCDLHAKTEDEIAKKFTIDASQNPNYKKACRFADESQKILLADYPYQYACNLKLTGAYVDAEKAFRRLADYKDSRERAAECADLEHARIYETGISKMSGAKYQEAIAIFQGLGNFRDSVTKIAECKELENQGIYDDAMMRMKAGEYLSAAGIFMKIRGYKDATEKVNECERLDVEKNNQFIYMRGVSYMNDNKYAEAIREFESIRGFKDASSLLLRCRNTIHEIEMSKRRRNIIGDTIYNSVFCVPVGGIIGLVVGFVMNVVNFLSSRVLDFSIWDWWLCLNVGVVGCVLGLAVAFLCSYFDNK